MLPVALNDNKNFNNCIWDYKTSLTTQFFFNASVFQARKVNDHIFVC